MAGMWVLIIIVSGGAFALSRHLANRKKNELESSGKIVERKNSFFKQAHFFSTKTNDLNVIGNAIDKNVLGEEKLSYEPNIANGQIVFHNRINFGSFGAHLVSLGAQDGQCRYKFQVTAWREGQYGITRQDLFGANVLLTAIEKAFLYLDPYTNVERANASYKSKLF